MSTEEVAKKVVELTRKQAWKEALESLYGKDIVSVESRANESGSPETRGIDGVRGKVDWWLWDGKEDWKIGSLTTEQRRLSIASVLNDTPPTRRL